MQEWITMNDKERQRLKIIARLEEGTLTRSIAAKQLKISTRQLRRLLAAFHAEGDKGVVSRKRGKKSNNSLCDEIRSRALELIRVNYLDFGPTLAHEKLVEVHGLRVSVGTIRTLMIKDGIWRPRKEKDVKIFRLREPRDCYGELIQMDGSYHDWFEGRLPSCCLIVLIDDATSRLVSLKFVEWESTRAYFSVLRCYLETVGCPLSLYTDRLAVFETTRKAEKTYKDTQFHRALKELGIELILALSPQAKGRVERANGILQDRLVKEMRLEGISSLEEANAFLPGFVVQYNKKFAKRPKSPIDAHKTINGDCMLERILSMQYERKITKDLLVYWGGNCYQIISPNKNRLGGKTVLVLEKEDQSIELLYKGESLEFIDFDKRCAEKDRVLDASELLNNWKASRGGHPPENHPWKAWKPAFLRP